MQDFLFQPIDGVLRDLGYDAAQSGVGPLTARIADAIEESRASFKAWNEERAMGLHHAAVRIAADAELRRARVSAEPDAAMGRAVQVSMSSGLNVWVHEVDARDAFVAADRIAGLREALRSRQTGILGPPARR